MSVASNDTSRGHQDQSPLTTTDPSSPRQPAASRSPLPVCPKATPQRQTYPQMFLCVETTIFKTGVTCSVLGGLEHTLFGHQQVLTYPCPVGVPLSQGFLHKRGVSSNVQKRSQIPAAACLGSSGVSEACPLQSPHHRCSQTQENRHKKMQFELSSGIVMAMAWRGGGDGRRRRASAAPHPRPTG